MAWKLRDIAGWTDRDAVIDTWIDQREQRSIRLYALRDPLRDEGYVAVGQKFNGAGPRTIILLRYGDQLRSLDPGTELRLLRQRAREVTRRVRDTWSEEQA